jgi:hypothetical protein
MGKPIIELTRKEKLFADGILEGKKKFQAALDVYDINAVDKRRSAGVVASVNLHKERVIKYLTRQGYGAAARIVKMSKNAKNETVRLSANQDILDRANIGNEKNGPIVPIQINFNDAREEFE